MTVFTRWRDKQPPGTDIKTLLAEELERSDLGSPSGELLTGSLVLTRTGAPVTRQGSHTSPLSPDLIKRCADDFKFKYRTTFCKIRADPLNTDSIVPFTDMYTNLVLEEGYRDHKRPLEYRDLFDLKVNGEFPKQIMVQGEAGAGKTTFCAKIAWDWITENHVLPKFVWVLVVPFREAKQYMIGEIAKSYLSKDNPATACQITEYIRSNPKDIIAFDGLDELDGKVVQQRKAGSKSECHQPKSSTPTSDTLQPRVNSAEASGSSSERGDIALGDILSSDELAARCLLKEFGYFLYFMVSTNQEEMDFLLDVSFESQDLDTAALVRGGTSSLTINHITTAHTIAGYVFTGLYKDVVRTLTLNDVRCPTSASSQHLAEALCAMPNLTELTLQGNDLQEEFFSTLNAKASTLQLAYGSCRPPESRDTCGGRRGSGDVETNPGQNRIVSVLSEKELLTLSKKIEPSFYKDVGINLDISIAELGQIKERSQNTSNALMTVFKRWRDKQPPGTDMRALLAEKLKKSDLGSLSGELLAGSLVLKGAGISVQSKSNEESSSPTHRSDKTTSYPSSPNTRTSTTTPTTAAAATTISQKAFFVIALLAWVAVTVSGTTPEISSTTGDTVNIPCFFGEGTVRNIFWSYNDGTGRHKILFLAHGNLHKEAEYENRASLQGDFSTLILKDISVADEGTYRCDVDPQGLTVVTNISTKLNVFSLRPDTFPVISPCTGANKSSSCIIHANQSVTLTCTLPDVHPVENAELIWYQDGQRVSSTDNVTQNDDGTIDISRQIQVSKTGYFTCNAMYLSVNGKENTVVSVEAWIIPLATDVANTPGKNLTSSLIAWKTISIVLLVGIFMAIIAFFLVRFKLKGQYSRGDECEMNEPQLNKVVAEASSHPIRGDTET